MNGELKSDEKHQFCFSFMRSDTGGQRTKTFWGYGPKEEAYKGARAQAESYRRSYENELNEKKRRKEYYAQYRSSDIRVDIVHHTCWR